MCASPFYFSHHQKLFSEELLSLVVAVLKNTVIGLVYVLTHLDASFDDEDVSLSSDHHKLVARLLQASGDCLNRLRIVLSHKSFADDLVISVCARPINRFTLFRLSSPRFHRSFFPLQSLTKGSTLLHCNRQLLIVFCMCLPTCRTIERLFWTKSWMGSLFASTTSKAMTRKSHSRSPSARPPIMCMCAMSVFIQSSVGDGTAVSSMSALVVSLIQSSANIDSSELASLFPEPSDGSDADIQVQTFKTVFDGSKRLLDTVSFLSKYFITQIVSRIQSAASSANDGSVSGKKKKQSQGTGLDMAFRAFLELFSSDLIAMLNMPEYPCVETIVIAYSLKMVSDYPSV